MLFKNALLTSIALPALVIAQNGALDEGDSETTAAVTQQTADDTAATAATAETAATIATAETAETAETAATEATAATATAATAATTATQATAETAATAETKATNTANTANTADTAQVTTAQTNQETTAQPTQWWTPETSQWWTPSANSWWTPSQSVWWTPSTTAAVSTYVSGSETFTTTLAGSGSLSTLHLSTKEQVVTSVVPYTSGSEIGSYTTTFTTESVYTIQNYTNHSNAAIGAHASEYNKFVIPAVVCAGAFLLI